MTTHSHIQLGKNGVTPAFIETLKDHFKNHENVKISVLKSAGHNKESVTGYSKDILEKLGRNYTARVLGFTIFLKKWKRNVR